MDEKHTIVLDVTKSEPGENTMLTVIMSTTDILMLTRNLLAEIEANARHNRIMPLKFTLFGKVKVIDG